MTSRIIARPAPWWEVVEITPEGRQIVVATAANEAEALAIVEHRSAIVIKHDVGGRATPAALTEATPSLP